MAQGQRDASVVSGPSEADVRDAYPKDARNDGVSGNVTLGCAVSEAGRLEDCEVLVESPSGVGFAEAALSLTSAYVYSPASLDGQPMMARTVVQLDFSPPAKGAAFGEIATYVPIGVACLVVLALLVAARRIRRQKETGG